MLQKKLQNALNEQLNLELATSQRYLASAAWCHSRNLPGFAAWFLQQAQRHEAAAMQYYNYIAGRKGTVNITGMLNQPANYSTILDLMEKTMAHEQSVADAVNQLHELAQTENDKPTLVVLNKYVIGSLYSKEQFLDRLIANLKMVGTSGHAIIMIDRSLGAR